MNKIEQKVLKKIKSGEIKMRPRWQFVVRARALRGAEMLILGAGGMALVGVLGFLMIIKNEELWQLGEIGQQLIIEDFPYGWLAGTIILLIGGGVIWRNIGSNYRKSYGQGWLMVTGTVLLLGCLLYIFF